MKHRWVFMCVREFGGCWSQISSAAAAHETGNWECELNKAGEIQRAGLDTGKWPVWHPLIVCVCGVCVYAVGVFVCVRQTSINLMNCLLLSITSNHSKLLSAHFHHHTHKFNMRHAIIDHVYICVINSVETSLCVRVIRKPKCDLLRSILGWEKHLTLRMMSPVNQWWCDKQEGQNVNGAALFYLSTRTWCDEKLMSSVSFTPQPKWGFKSESGGEKVVETEKEW